MRPGQRPCLAILFLLAATVAPGRNVVVLPAGAGQPVSLFKGDPLASAGSISLSSPAFAAFANPAATKYYLVSREPTDTIVVVNATFTTRIQTFNLAGGTRAAAMTPDGKRLVLLGSTLRIFDTSTDREILPSSNDFGNETSDLGISQDSSRAYVLNMAARRLTAVDLATNTVAAVLTLPGILVGLTVAPSDLLYVAAQNRFLEIDGRAMTLRGEIPLNELPTRAVFLPDGRFVASNTTPLTGSALILVNPLTRSVARLANFFLPGITLERIYAVSNTRLMGTTAGTLYDISLNPLSVGVADFTSAGAQGAVTGLASSGELVRLPSGAMARYLYLVQNKSLNRIDLSLNIPSGSSALGAEGAAAVYAGPASTDPVKEFLPYTTRQTVLPGGRSAPLVVRLLDANGRVVYNAPVTFTSDTPGTLIETPTAYSNMDGFAQTFVTVPSSGLITITAAMGGDLTQKFIISVGDPTPGVPSSIELLGGNGQVLAAGSGAPEALRVAVGDAYGNSVEGAEVTWTLSGPGVLSRDKTQTDANGQTGVFFIGPDSIGGLAFATSPVRASIAGLSVNFSLTTASFAPNVVIVAPSSEPLTVTGAAGQTLPGAVQVRVASQLGQGFPNVSLRTSAAFDPEAQLSAGCIGDSNGFVYTDRTGLASCDLRLGGTAGESRLTLVIGSFTSGTVGLKVTKGPPTLVRVVRGDKQSGPAGQVLANALVAQVTDAFGNILPSTPVKWEVVPPGGATLSNVLNGSNEQGLVSALPTLGSSAGTVLVRVTAEAATAVFSMTVTSTSAGITKVSGDNQTASQNQAFGQPLVVRVADQAGKPVPGLPVAFVVANGRATLGATSATTDADGKASTTVRAGDDSGAITIAVFVQNLTTAFTLNVRVPGPVVSASDVLNAASQQPGASPGAILTISGTDIAPGVEGTVRTNPASPLPTILAGASVRFGLIFGPIFSVSNINGKESIRVQAPFDLQPGVVPVTIDANGFSTTVNVRVTAYQPGIFETVFNGRPIATLTRLDGTAVTPDNPARRGEVIRMQATGLGQTTPVTGTNRLGGTDQKVAAQVIVGVNGEGVAVLNAQYAPRNIGLYYVDFRIPEETATGPDRSLALAVRLPDGTLVFGPGSKIPIR